MKKNLKFVLCSRSFVFRVILPSTHKPLGDGVDWHDYIDPVLISLEPFEV